MHRAPRHSHDRAVRRNGEFPACLPLAFGAGHGVGIDGVRNDLYFIVAADSFGDKQILLRGGKSYDAIGVNHCVPLDSRDESARKALGPLDGEGVAGVNDFRLAGGAPRGEPSEHASLCPVGVDDVVFAEPQVP